MSDGPNAWPLGDMQTLLATLQAIDATIKAGKLPENELMA